MLIRCPSCSKEYESDEHLGAFEINCSCGYSIILPDENLDPAAFKAPLPELKGPAAALEAEDNAVAISMAEAEPLAPENVGQHLTSAQLTPPDQLPEEMPYDPQELATLKEQINAEMPQAELLSEDLQSSIAMEIEAKDFQFNDTQNVQEPLPVAKPSEPDSIELIKTTSPFNLGETTRYYDLHIENIGPENIQRLKKRCEWLFTGRPWLKIQSLNAGFNLDQLETSTHIRRIPEALALDLYLYTYELGGRCHYNLHQEASKDSQENF